MPRQLSSEKKAQIVALSEAGFGIREIGRKLGCSHATVRKWVQQHKSTGSVDRKVRTNWTRKTTAATDRLIVLRSLKNRSLTAEDIRQELFETENLNVGVHTVRRRLCEAGLHARRPAKKPLLTARMMQDRLKWAKEHSNWTLDDWKNVLWSDESKFNVRGSDGMDYVRRRKGERYKAQCVKKTTRSTQSQMIWGCFSFYGVGRLCLIDGKVNAAYYKNILYEYMVPSMEHHLSEAEDFIFQDDSAPCHRAQTVRDYLQNLGVRTLRWPGNSPDLNPIENLWRMMKVKVRKCKPNNLKDLQQKIEKIWFEEISVDLIKNLTLSMPNRIKAVIKSKGGPTKY